MRRLALLAATTVFITSATASAQNYTFGDWARDQGYEPGDAMPEYVRAYEAGIDSLDGIQDFDWLNTMILGLESNRISTIEPGDFDGLIYLQNLYLHYNQISSIDSGVFSGADLTHLELGGNPIVSIESGAFSNVTNLRMLGLSENTVMTDLNLEAANLSRIFWFNVRWNRNITSVSLRNAIVSPSSLGYLFYSSRNTPRAIGQVEAAITELDLSGIDFTGITDLESLYRMDDLTDLWIVNSQNMDAVLLDILLDNLETIEGTDTEGVLHMTQSDFDAFNTAGGDLLSDWNDEPGHHVEFLSPGDVSHDSEVNGLDVDPFVDVLLGSRFDVAADMNEDQVVNGLDIDPFVDAVIDAGGAHVATAGTSVPESSTLALAALSSLGLLGYRWRQRKYANN